MQPIRNNSVFFISPEYVLCTTNTQLVKSVMVYKYFAADLDFHHTMTENIGVFSILDIDVFGKFIDHEIAFVSQVVCYHSCDFKCVYSLVEVCKVLRHPVDIADFCFDCSVLNFLKVDQTLINHVELLYEIHCRSLH